MNIETVEEAKSIIRWWADVELYMLKTPVKEIKKERDNLDDLKTEIEDMKDFITRDIVLRHIDETLESMNDAISFMQTDEENWTLGI